MTIILPSPDFTWDPKANPPKAGLRPKRNGTYRLAPEPLDGRLIVHNYGHAGAGITMSWGCAIEVAQIIAAAGHGAGEEVAVLGGGVVGLTAAVILAERAFKVTVFAKDYPPNTTSNVAGGQWAPASVQHNDKVQFERILKNAFDMHSARGAAYGVSPRLNYATQKLPSFADVPMTIVPPPKVLAHLPFARLNSPGFVYSTLLVEPPIFLPKLLSDLDDRKVLQSRSRKSGQDDKWNFCLTTAIIAVNRRDHEETTPPEPLSGLQGEGGAGRRQGRPNDSPAGRAFRRSS